MRARARTRVTPTYYVCSLDATSEGMHRIVDGSTSSSGGRCCSVRHMGEHAIPRAAGTRFASWRVYRLVIHRRNVPWQPFAVCTPASADTLRATIRQPPLLPRQVDPVSPIRRRVLSLRVAESGTRRGTRGISANSIPIPDVPMGDEARMQGRIALRSDLW